MHLTTRLECIALHYIGTLFAVDNKDKNRKVIEISLHYTPPS